MALTIRSNKSYKKAGSPLRKKIKANFSVFQMCVKKEQK